ncbi:MAG: hypothetical protein AAGL66_04625 [Pseudomonadota bacterium]
MRQLTDSGSDWTKFPAGADGGFKRRHASPGIRTLRLGAPSPASRQALFTALKSQKPAAVFEGEVSGVRIAYFIQLNG